MSSDIVYKCDPQKNTECKKRSCQSLCFHTLNSKYSADGRKYRYNVNTDEFEDMDTGQ